MDETMITVLTGVAALIVGAAISGFIFFKQGIAYRRREAESVIGSAEKEAERILEDAGDLCGHTGYFRKGDPAAQRTADQ